MCFVLNSALQDYEDAGGFTCGCHDNAASQVLIDSALSGGVGGSDIMAAGRGEEGRDESGAPTLGDDEYINTTGGVGSDMQEVPAPL